MDKGDPVRNVPDLQRGPVQHDARRRPTDGINASPGSCKTTKSPTASWPWRSTGSSRDQDEKTLGLVFIDFKSLEVRHLGSIYEGLLEFKLKVADDDLTTQTEKNQEKYIPLSQAKAKRGKPIEVVVKKGEVYLSNDKAERKASGSYYTPDPIVEYIVAQTVGPVLDEKLEGAPARVPQGPQDVRQRGAESDGLPAPGNQLQGQRSHPAVRVEKTYRHAQGPGRAALRPEGARPGDGQRPLPGRGGRLHHRPTAQVPERVPDQPGEFRPGADPHSILESLGEQGVTVDPRQAHRHQPAQAARPEALHLRRRSQPDGRGTGQGEPVARRLHAGRAAELPRSSPALRQLAGRGDLHESGKGHIGPALPPRLRPLLRAINYVLFVSKIADATAAEVAGSVSQYDQARQALSGYQIVLDLLVAEHFGMPEATALVTHGDDLDLTDREQFLKSLNDDKERAGRQGRGAGPSTRSSLLPLGDRVPRGVLRLHRRQ